MVESWLAGFSVPGGIAGDSPDFGKIFLGT